MYEGVIDMTAACDVTCHIPLPITISYDISESVWLERSRYTSHILNFND